nr:hypothetical protein Iba_chr15aCG12420 [Ipomoea batatas]
MQDSKLSAHDPTPCSCVAQSEMPKAMTLSHPTKHPLPFAGEEHLSEHPEPPHIQDDRQPKLPLRRPLVSFQKIQFLYRSRILSRPDRQGQGEPTSTLPSANPTLSGNPDMGEAVAAASRINARD